MIGDLIETDANMVSHLSSLRMWRNIIMIMMVASTQSNQAKKGEGERGKHNKKGFGTLVIVRKIKKKINFGVVGIRKTTKLVCLLVI